MNRPLLSTSASLIGTQLVSAGLGAAFWWLAAHHFTPSAVGVGSAAVSAMLLLGSLSTVGLGTLLMGELATRPGLRMNLLLAALMMAACVGLAAGSSAAFVAPFLSGDLASIRMNVLSIASFTAGVAVTSVAIVLDQALVGVLRGGLQFWRNTVFSLAKLAGLGLCALVVSSRSSLPIYGSWAAATMTSILTLMIVYLRSPTRARTPRPDWATLLAYRGSAVAHHLFNLALQAPALTLPILVVLTLSAEQNASFYIAWQIALLLFMVPTSLTYALYSVSAHRPTDVARYLRLTLRASIATSAAGVLLVVPLAPEIAGVFGARYGASSSTPLRILVVAAFPLLFKTHYVALCRVRGTIRRTLPLVWMGIALEVACASAGAWISGDLRGFTVGWLGALCLEAVVIAPTVLRAAAPSET